MMGNCINNQINEEILENQYITDKIVHNLQKIIT